MSLQLHEYAWLHILDLLAPLEWTRTYEVFPSSRTAVLRKWKMLGQERGGCQGGISLTDFRLFNRDYTCDIFVEDAQKMLIQAGPFFKYLQMIFGNIDSTVLFIEIGIPKLDNCFWYKVVGANVNSLVETLCMLFKNVTTIFTHSTCLNHFCERGITDGVKVLECYFVKPTDEFHCNSFKGHFRNLEKLRVEVASSPGVLKLEDFFTKTLQYCNSLKSLHIELPFRAVMTHVGFENILGLPQLEELEFVWNKKPDSFDYILDKFSSHLPQLRSVKIREIAISDREFCSLMSLPQLEFLEMEPEFNYYPTEYPEANNLTKCKINFMMKEKLKANFGSEIVKFLKQMPSLQYLVLDFGWKYPINQHFSEFCDIVFQLISFALSRYKQIEAVVMSRRLYIEVGKDTVQRKDHLLKLSPVQKLWLHLQCSTKNIDLALKELMEYLDKRMITTRHCNP